MKKIIVLGAVALASSNACAADLPAKIDHVNVSCLYNDIQYVTEDGEVAYMDYSEEDTKEAYKAKLIDKQVYYDNVKALARGFNLFPDDQYYIDANSDLYQYAIDGDMMKRQKIDGISDCLKVCCGKDFIIVLKKDGTVWSWGENKYGQLGNGTFDTNNTPSRIETLEDVVDISCTYSSGYAVTSEGEVYFWGERQYYVSDVRDGSINNESYGVNAPVQILEGVGDCIRVESCDSSTTYILTAGGDVYQCSNNGGYEYKPRKLSIENCVDISSLPWSYLYISPMFLLEDGTVYQRVANPFSTGYPEFGKATYISDIVKVVGGYKNTYIKSDGSMWIIEPDKDGFWNCGEPKCIVEADDENRLKIESVRFIKRSEAADKFLKLYEDLCGQEVSTEQIAYEDVDSIYSDSIEKSAAIGIMNGTGENTFSPNKVLRREQAAVILSRVLEKTGKIESLSEKREKFTDDSDISEWAKESVYKTASLFGELEQEYDPHEYISSDELNEIIRKAIAL